MREAHADAFALPLPHGLTEEPQTHHIAQETDPAVGADFIGEVGDAGRRVDDPIGQLDADQSPGAA